MVVDTFDIKKTLNNLTKWAVFSPNPIQEDRVNSVLNCLGF